MFKFHWLLFFVGESQRTFLQSTHPASRPASLLEEFTSVTINCKLILLSDFPSQNQFPLSWSRNGGLPSGATTAPSTENDGSARTYYLALTFIVTASVNNNPLSCNAVTPSNSGSTSYTPSVILRPSQPQIQGPVTARAGQVLTWTCTSEGASFVSPNVYWRNGQGQALVTGVTHSTQIGFDSYGNRIYSIRSNLTTALPPVSAQYELECRIVHDYQGYNYKTSNSRTVSLIFPPQLTKSSGDTVFTTETVKTTISCIISASSPDATSVSWTKNGQPVDFSSGDYEVVSVRSPSLVITSAKMGDAGDYVCTATNVEGTTSFDTPTTLVVRYSPSITYPGGTSFQASLGASFTLPCPVDALPNATTIRWKRISSTGVATYLNIQNEARYSGSTAQVGGLGKFTANCFYGNCNMAWPARPAVSTPQTSVTAVENSAATLTCDVAPLSSLTSLTWRRGGVALDTSDPAKYSGGTRFTPSLVIFRVADSDVGNYACVAENPYGVTTSGLISLTVTYAPRLTVSGVTIRASVGETIVLNCGVNANPAISSLYWTRANGGAAIDSAANPQKYSGGSAGSPNLIIFGADSLDTGQYVCVAENSVGETTSDAVTVSVTALPQVTAGPPTTVTVPEGTAESTLLCTVSGNPAVNNVYWLRNGALVDTVASPAKYSGSSLSTPSLTIRDLVRGDSGQYVCAAVNSIGATNSQTVTVTVTYRPTLTIPSQPISRIAGSTIALTCAVDATPAATDFYWTRIDPSTGGSVTLSAADNPNKYFGGTLGDNTLYILSAQNSDSGSYRCIATNSIGTTSSNLVTVSVTSIPQVNVLAPPTSVTEGTSQLTLTCTVTSNPAPTSVSWLKGGVVLETSSQPAKYQGGTVATPSLTIRSIDRSDSGAYTCVVVNSVGTGSSGVVQLNVVYRPTLTVSDTPLSTGEGGTVVLTCIVDSNPDITSFYWSRVGQGRISSASNPTKYGGGTITDQSLLIFGATSADSGQYFCSASNRIGSIDSSIVSISVTNVPTVTISQTSVTVSEGSAQYVLTCSVTATPAATDIYWNKGGSGRLDTENSGTTNQGLSKLSGGTVDNPSLVIRSVDRGDAGAYTCVARNSIGTGFSPTVTLTVTYRPTLTVSTTNILIEAGSSTLLACGVSAVPSLTSLYWTKDGVRIDPSQNPSKYNGGTRSVPSLTIFNADVTSDPGSYTCVATNSIGTTFSDPVNLVVSSVPLTNNGSNINTTRGGQVTLYCTTQVSNTTSTIINDIYWTRNGIRLTSPQEAITQNRVGGNILFPDVTFDPVTPEEAGVYTCVIVTAEELLVGDPLTLEVTYRPIVKVVGTFVTVPESVVNKTLECIIQASPRAEKVYWLRDGLRLDTQTQELKYSGGTPDNPSLTIYNVDRDDHGTYFCVGVSSLGKGSSKALNFRVSWLKYSGGTPDNPSLTIYNVDRDDHGTYFCVGVNFLGKGSSKALNFRVSYIPTITTDQGPITAKNGTSVTLTCAVSAYPEPSRFYWRKDGARLNLSLSSEKYRGGNLLQTSLTILEVMDGEDSGVYSCVAENELGVSTSPDIQLEIEVARPIITPPPASVTGTENSVVTLPCEITPLDSLQAIKWQKNNVDLDISNSARYLGGTVSNPSLTLLAPTDADSGAYRCVATNQYGNSTGGSTSLDIQSIKWQKNSVDLDISNSARYLGGTVSNPSLTLLAPTDADSGAYRCVATNQYGNSTGGSTSLDIQYRPRLTVATNPISTNPGPSISLTCQVDANPAPSSLYWTKRGTGQIVSAASSKYLGGTASNPTLTITTTEISDAGEYFCTVNNTIGTTESPAVVLRVITIPDVNISPPSAVVEEETPSLVLGCTVVASPPATLVAWTLNGVILDTTSGTTTSGSGPKYTGGNIQTNSLTINDVRRTDAGIYVCVATNAEGVGNSSNLRVDVTYVPTLTVPSSPVTGARGSSLTLPCGVEAFPPLISIKWVKDGSGDVDLSQKTSSGQNKYSGGTLVAPDLTIVELNEFIDTGVYRCVAENARGTVTSGPVQAGVTYDPVITVPDAVTAKEGDNAFTIPCNIQMYPAANSITWYKDNAAFDPGATPSKYLGGTLAVPTLTILTPKGSDSGIYKCQASNGQGVDITSSDIPVTVTFPPRITASTALVTQDRGQPVTLQVAVEAIPTPTSIKWQTSDIDSGSSVRSDLTIAGRLSGGTIQSPSLTISGLQPSDSANYYITVTNDEGSTTVGPIPLRVRYQPTNVQATASPALLQTGNTLTLSCSADAWPQITSYEWTRDGAGGAVLATGSVYTKTQVGADDYALFRCTVKNSVGTQSATVRPNIQFAPVQTNPGVVLESAAVGSTVTLICDVTANPTPTYTWYDGVDVIAGAVARTYTLQVNAEADFGSYSCSAENTLGTLNPAGEFSVQESDPNVGASIGGDDGLSTATIILIVIIVVIFLIIVILAIIFCCMQGLCAKWCGKNKETAKVAPTTYNPPQPAPVYMNGGLVGTTAEPTTKVMLDDEPNDVDKQFRPLNPGAIISVPEKQGPRAHYLPPLVTESENVDNYYREEKRRSRKKRKHRRHRQADDKDALTGADATDGANGVASGAGSPGRSGDLESSRSFGRASENVYEN
ncbi:hemicentin-1 [Elysia marginata]|uniref:Hemicentin-1 n=1 Tax=Elysia marginata TaxID=1093978 RepID=A0AAV4F2C0_9GAST|nr:hemicentin-1 [Elysia marginata]